MAEINSSVFMSTLDSTNPLLETLANRSYQVFEYSSEALSLGEPDHTLATIKTKDGNTLFLLIKEDPKEIPEQSEA